MNLKRLYLFIFFLLFFSQLNAQNDSLQEVVIVVERKNPYHFRLNDSLFLLPASVVRLDEKKIQSNNLIDMAPVLNTIPGVFMQSATLSTNRISIRGIGGRTPYGTNKIRAFYGNIPLTSGDSETTIEDLDMELIREIEVIKGPLSSAYGAGLGGAILIQPKRIHQNGHRLNLTTTVGSFGLVRNQLGYGFSNDNTTVNASYHRIEMDGFRENSTYFREGITIAGEVLKRENSGLHFITNYTEVKSYIPSSVDEETYRNRPEDAAANWFQAQGYEAYKLLMAGMNYEWKVSESITNATSLFMQIKDADEPRPFDILRQNNQSVGGRTQFTGLFDIGKTALHTTWGAEIFSDIYKANTYENLYLENEDRGSLQGAAKNRLTQNRSFVNIYVQSRWILTSKWEVNAGVNYNKTQFRLQQTYPLDHLYDTDYSYDGILAPQFALTFLPNKQQTIYFSASRGYALPSIDETLNEQGGINTDIRPENGYNFELGSKYRSKNNNFLAEAALYHMQINDLLVAQRVLEDQYVGVNAGATLHQGIEILAQYRFRGGQWSLEPYMSFSYGNYRFLEFVNNDVDYEGNDLTGVPKSQVTAGYVFGLPYGLQWHVDYYFVDKIPLNDANSLYTDAYHLINTRLSFQTHFTEKLFFSINAGINNAFDTKYASMVLVNATGFGNTQPRYYYPGQPINYYSSFQLKYHF